MKTEEGGLDWEREIGVGRVGRGRRSIDSSMSVTRHSSGPGPRLDWTGPWVLLEMGFFSSSVGVRSVPKLLCNLFVTRPKQGSKKKKRKKSKEKKGKRRGE